MSLDLDDLTESWQCPSGEVRARIVEGRDGAQMVQLRIDLGVLQMFPDGRPDGARYRGRPMVLDVVERLRSDEAEIGEEDGRELEREINQLNYRRLAFGSLAEEAMKRNDSIEAAAFLSRAVRDVDFCIRAARIVAELRGKTLEPGGFVHSLVFTKARMATQLRIVEGLYDEAIEAALAGVRAVEDVLVEIGVDSEQIDQDPGVTFLRQFAQRLREQYNLPQTLAERLEEAIQNEDFEAAAALQEELRRRQRRARPMLPPAAGDEE